MIRFDYNRNVILARGKSIDLDDLRKYLLSNYPHLCYIYKLPTVQPGVVKYAWDSVFNDARQAFIVDFFLDERCL